MSTRQLRKLQKQRELEITRLKENELDDEEYDEPPTPPGKKGCMFANLLAVEDIENEDDDKDSEEHENEGEIFIPNLSISVKPRELKSKQNKNKNKNFRKSKAKSIDRVGGEDIERVLRQLDIKSTSDLDTVSYHEREDDDAYKRICAIVSVQGKFLKVANEMQKLFGKAAVESNNEMGGISGEEPRQRQQQDEMVDFETALSGTHLAGKGMHKIILRRNFFIQGKNDWPKGTLGGLSMEVVGEEKADGTVEFCYSHNQAYQRIQKQFLKFVNLGDPQILVNLLVKYPDHISLLIQVSRIAKNLGKHALSSDLLERALFFLGKAAISHFTTKLSQGKARLNFSRPENRELWLAGYHYIKSLMMKGTYRTALEWAKLLLSLAPETDPYCMQLLIHNLSLRAHEHRWLCDLYDTGFPGRWRRDIKSSPQSLYSHTNPSLVLAAIHMQDQGKAREILSQSMSRLPWLYSCLFSQLNLEIPSVLKEHAARSKADALFTKIYITQTKDLWNKPDAISLLMEVGNSISRVDNFTLDDDDDDDSNLIKLDIVRFVYLDGTPELLALIPREQFNRGFNSESDPIPPAENIYSYDAQRIGNSGSSQFGINYVAITRLSPNRNDNNEESNSEFTLYGISFTDITEDGGQGFIPLEAARRLFRHLRGSEGSDDEEETHINLSSDIPESNNRGIEVGDGIEHSVHEENNDFGVLGEIMIEAHDRDGADDNVNNENDNVDNENDNITKDEGSIENVSMDHAAHVLNSEGSSSNASNSINSSRHVTHTRNDGSHEENSSNFSSQI
ncbi:Transcription factor 25 [Golovinomyces cichoracearum]|uniref:Transcription factor 25 n=1 Tax=Golovinomyces cichoracearum TaxID=62708 RepID=A0A420HJJ8_9PEZI|nr:Transcription factor 25 [Golovinomyces cichoracearum]